MDFASHMTLRKGGVTLAVLACAALLFAVAFAPRASAFPMTGGVQPNGACDGCHTGGGNAPAVTLVSTGATGTTYSVAPNGIEWAAFSGATRAAGGNGAGTFVVPADTTYTIYDVLGDPGTASSAKTTVVGGKATYTIAPSSAGANGTISPANTQGVVSGGSATFTITAKAGYHVDTVTADGVPVTLTAGAYTFTNVTANHAIAASFAADAVTTYTITPSAGANGTISPATAQTVASGGSKTFTITPTPGYRVATLKVDGAAVTATTSYTFSNVTANHTISAAFAAVAQKCTVTVSLTGLKAGVLRLRKVVTVKGVVKPAHGGNATVTIQRKVGTKWVAAKTVARPMNATSGAYSYAYKPTKAGSYRVKTSVAKTALYTAATTAYKTFKVK